MKAEEVGTQDKLGKVLGDDPGKGAEADHAGRGQREFPPAMAALWVDFQSLLLKPKKGVIENETEKEETMSTNNLSTLRS